MKRFTSFVGVATKRILIMAGCAGFAGLLPLVAYDSIVEQWWNRYMSTDGINATLSFYPPIILALVVAFMICGAVVGALDERLDDNKKTIAIVEDSREKSRVWRYRWWAIIGNIVVKPATVASIALFSVAEGLATLNYWGLSQNYLKPLSASFPMGITALYIVVLAYQIFMSFRKHSTVIETKPSHIW
jgi:hypothetical protein